MIPEQLAAIFYTLTALIAMVGRFFTYEKMGIEGYKSFVPLYCDYVIFNRCGQRRRFWLFGFFAVLAVTAFVMGMMMGFAAVSVSDTTAANGMLAASLLFVGFSLVMAIVVIVIQIPVYITLADQFGREAIFGIGFVLAPPVLWPMAAWSSHFQYDVELLEKE
jgi:MFS family permease